MTGLEQCARCGHTSELHSTFGPQLGRLGECFMEDGCPSFVRPNVMLHPKVTLDAFDRPSWVAVERGPAFFR